MTYYYLLFAVSCIGASLFLVSPSTTNHCINIHQDKRKKTYLKLVFFLAFLLIGLRGINVGKDTHAYVYEYFYVVKDLGIFSGGFEIVINIIARISLVFSDNYQLFLILNAGLVAYLFGKFIYDNSQNVILSTLIFIGMFFIPSMNLMREWLAIGFGINAFALFRNKRNKSAFIFLIIACLSHITAITLLFIPLIEMVNNKKKLFKWVSILCIVFYLSRNYFLFAVISFVPNYQGYLINPYFLNEGGFNIRDAIFIVIELYYFYIIIFKNNKMTNDEYNKCYEYATLLLIAITLSFSGQIYSILGRLVYYYSVFLIISLPEMISKSRFKLVISFALIIGMFLMLQRNSYSDNNGIANYHFFWK